MGAAIELMHPEAGTIFMSGIATDNWHFQNTHSEKVRSFLQKPFTAESLIIAVKEVIRGAKPEASM